MTVSAAVAALPDALAPFHADWSDPSVEDIFVVGPGHYFVRRGGTTERREAPALDALSVEAIAAFAGHLRGQYADEDHPLLDCELPTGERLSFVMFPCTPAGKPSLALRRASAELPNLEQLNNAGLWDIINGKRGFVPSQAQDMHAERVNYAKSLLAGGEVTRFWRYCIQQRWSIAFVGETGSGKTYDTTALVMEIPREDRIITVADTEEWARLPHQNRVSFLHTKGGAITGEMLIEAALRNAPRWLLVQEIRDASAFAFLRGLIVSPGISTWHARSAATAFDALSMMIRQHPAGARLPEDALRAMMRAFVTVVAHVERGPDGAFCATDIRFGQDIE